MLNRYLTLLLLSSITCTFAQDAPTFIDLDAPIRRRVIEELPKGNDIMANVRARMAQSPLFIQAELTTTGSKDTLHVEAQINWGSTPATAQYVLFSQSGEQLYDLTLTWNVPGKAPLAMLRSGLDDAKTPVSLFASIDPLPLQWSDLTFSWLWWPNATTHSTDTRKTRDCIIVDLPRPEWDKSPYAFLRLWIDRNEWFLLHGEAFDQHKQRLRKIDARSLKKFGEIWMLKDFTIKQYPDKKTTRIEITDMRLLKH